MGRIPGKLQHNKSTAIHYSGQKRGGDQVNQSASSKQSRQGEVSSSSGAANDFQRDMGLTGTGAEQASGGASSDGQDEYRIERPISNFGEKLSVYRKSHKFMTFGFAPNVIGAALSGGATNDYWLTTYLAELPWHLPCLYLNPSEFQLLDLGARCVEVNVQVYYRGSTIQFETATTSSGLATLNQINDIGVAHALNKTGWGSDVYYKTFGTSANSQTMVPQSIQKPRYKPVASVYRGMAADWYGVDNSVNPQFQIYVPKHQVGRQAFLPNYFALSTRSQAPAVGNTQALFGGWPCLTECIEQMDGKTFVDKPVISSTYKPKMGMLKQPLKHLGLGLPYPNTGGQIQIPINGNLAQMQQCTVTRDNIEASTSNNDGVNGDRMLLTQNNINPNNDDGPNTPLVPNWDIFSPIEKSQIARSGFWGQADAHVQPSVHFGVQPIPSLSPQDVAGNDVSGQVNKWTQTRGYWEVVAEMKVMSKTPTRLPHAMVPNVPQGDVIFTAPTPNIPPYYLDPKDTGTTFAGLHSMTPITLSEAS